MAEAAVCPYCSLSLHCAPDEHIQSCPNVFRCVSCQELLRTDRQEAHVRECRYTPCSFCGKSAGPGGLEVHLLKCLAASKCSKCGEFVPASKKYLHETRCKPAPAQTPKVPIECEVCHCICDNLSEGYIAIDDHMISHQLQMQENRTARREKAVPMRKCEFCEQDFPLESIDMHKRNCSERTSCGQCQLEIAKSQLEAHFQVCLPLQRPSPLDAIAVEGPVSAPFTHEMRISAPQLASRPREMPRIQGGGQEEEVKQPPAVQLSAPVQEVPMTWCDFCKSSVEARSTLYPVFPDHQLSHSLQQESILRAHKQQSRLNRDLSQSLQRYADVQSRRNLARHANDDSYFSPENYEVVLI